MAFAEVQALLAPQIPILIGKSYTRPAPAHVLNGFVAACCGVTDRGEALQQLLSTSEPPLQRFSSLSEAQWARSGASLSRFQTALSLVFNPDGRMWEDFGSPVPVHAHLASRDASDNRLGPLLWEIVRRYAGDDYARKLEVLFRPADARDPVTACALILVNGAQERGTRHVGVSDLAWFSARGTAGGKLLAREISGFIVQLTDYRPAAQRLAQIQNLGRGLYLSAFIALLLGPLAGRIRNKPGSVDEIGRILVWAGMPPGPPTHPMVMAAARSFQMLVARNRAALSATLMDALEAQPLPRNLPPLQRRRLALRNQLLAGGIKAHRVDDAIEQLADDAGVRVDGRRRGDPELCSKVVESVYPASFLTKGLRTKGRKVGFIGPDRGGIPRFVCETPLLGTLVSGLVPREGVDFPTFVDVVRERLGIVFGLGTCDDLAEDLGLWEGIGVGRRLLRDNEEALRQRLVRAGLAREYSDGNTEVIGDG